MAGIEGDEEIIIYETTLSTEARRRLAEIGWADIVIGIPSHRNGRTIGEVVRAIIEGIASYLPDQRVVLMNADGGSSDNTTRHVRDAVTPPNVEKLVVIYEGIMGKGTGIRAILETAAELHAKACMVVEARAPGILPEWVPALVNPVLNGDEAALGCYQRSAYAAALSDNLIYPFMRAFLNTDLREPLASEFCVSGTLAAELADRDVWETDVARFGINVWFSIQVLAEHRRVSQVDLGYRGEGSGEPGALLDARFLHTTGTLFRLLTVHRRLWQNPPPRPITFQGARCPDRMVPCRDCSDLLIAGLREGERQYGAAWQEILSPDMLEAVSALVKQPASAFDFPPELWARLVAEFAIVYNKGEGDPDKVVEAFLPLFYGRAAAYVQATRGLSWAEREAVVEEISRTFLAVKPLFLRQWNEYQPWGEPSEYWVP